MSERGLKGFRTNFIGRDSGTISKLGKGLEGGRIETLSVSRNPPGVRGVISGLVARGLMMTDWERGNGKMRTDAVIDKRMVECKHLIPTLGFDKWVAQVGDLILFDDGGGVKAGRMIGRIKDAPDLANPGKRLKNLILVIAITDGLFGGMHERWVRPEDVRRITPVRNQIDSLMGLFSDDLLRMPIDTARYEAAERSLRSPYVGGKHPGVKG